jgi:hypothetical protein
VATFSKIVSACALAVCAMWNAAAKAEVSDDLKFCGGLKSGAERLACYDAAARIAARPVTVRPARAAPPAMDAQAALPGKAFAAPAAPVRNPFDGYYAAIGGGYGVGSGRDTFEIIGPITRAGGALTSVQGPNLSFVVGRNIAIGWGLVGIELDARWSNERATSATDSFGYFNNLVTPGRSSYTSNNDAGIHASLRLGATFDDLLLFAKAGVGATRIAETFTADERGAQYCIMFGINACDVLSPPGTLRSIKTASWVPSANFGVGVEKNWGSVYGRLSADLEAFNHSATSVNAGGLTGSSSSAQIMWTTRGTAMVGVRF